MTDLKSKLSRLQAQAGAGGAAQSDTLSGLRQRIAQLEGGRHRRASPARRPEANRKQPLTRDAATPEATRTLATAVAGEAIDDGLIRIRERIPLSGELGAIALHSLRHEPRLPGASGDETRRRVYLDTETTGLSGGSGTLAFLVGIATVDEDAIELTRFLLTGFGAEAAMLSAFAATLSPDDRLISYNGKSYDVPLLATRFRMQGIAHPLDDLPHLDLLHPVRRLFGRRWDDCRLTSLERNLLGLQRVDDLPGSEAPAAWFGYVRFGQGAQLLRVVEHNRQDIVSLAAAHNTLARAVESPRQFGLDIHALARWLAEQDETKARALLEAHIDTLCADGKRFLGHLSRRAGNWPQAVAIWEALAAAGCVDSMERLAKFHEHVSKDLAAARRCCEQLPGDAARRHRHQRIEAKLARRRTRAGDKMLQPPRES